MRTEPDGLLGALLASESLGMTHSMINGPGGCRSRAQILLHELLPEYMPENQGCCRSKYFSRQSRLPCTYLNNGDMVFGADEKISEGLDSVSGTGNKGIVMVDTLGASLICTDFESIFSGRDPRPIRVDGDLAGMTMNRGFDVGTRTILESYGLEGGENGTVNLLGYSITDPGWTAGAENLRTILSLMGLEANIPGCLPSKDEMDRVGGAALSVMVRPESCSETARMLESSYGVPSLRLPEGAPIGYRAVRSFVKDISERTGADPGAALEFIDREERNVRRVLLNYDRAADGLHLKGMDISAESSTVLPLLKWMHGTFGMVPRHIEMTDDAYGAEVMSYLESYGLENALEGTTGTRDFVFSDGLTALEGRMSCNATSYVEVRMPRSRHLDLMGRCIVGTAGCRYLLDEMLNGVLRFRCGQPTDVDFRDGCKGC